MAALAPGPQKTSWPELECYDIQEAQAIIKQERRDITYVIAIPVGAEVPNFKPEMVIAIIEYEVEMDGENQKQYVAPNTIPYIV
jgi:hypothetical protein